MSQQYVEFDFPLPLRSSPDTARARTANTGWVQRRSLVRSAAALDWYQRWDMAKLAGYLYPYAEGADLDLATDTMAFFFLFDDQFDGRLGRDPAAATRVCHEMIRAVHGDRARRHAPAPPVVEAFEDFWARQRQGMSPGWQARAACNWEYFFAEYPHEAVDRCRAEIPGMEHYLAVRRGMGGTQTVLDLCERTGHFEVPSVAFHAPALLEMRLIAVDLLVFCNDVHSLRKEEPRGDVHNVVLVVEKQRQSTRAEALARISQVFETRIARFADLRASLPALLAGLGLSRTERIDVERYTESMALALHGHHQWELESARFTDSETVVPAHRPGYLEDLLNPPGTTEPPGTPGVL